MKKITTVVKYLSITLFLASLSGCASLQIKTPRPVVLQEDRIYTLPAGQSVLVKVDNVPQTLTFPTDMKITTTDHLIRTERKLNDAVLDKAKADKSRSKWIGIFGSLLAVLGGAFGVAWKQKGGKT